MTKQCRVQVKPLGPVGPRSSAINWVPPEPTMSEHGALECLKEERRRAPGDGPDCSSTQNREILIVDLDKYEFYGSPGSKRRDEFCPLYTQSPKLVKVSLNGFVSLGKSRVYVQSVPVSSYTIEGYGDADDETVTIFVQSKQASNDRSYDIWYRLTNQPTTGYRPFYDTFVWIATFCKHFLDYLGAHPNTSLGLSHFKIQFFKWLMARFKGGAYFQAWLKQFGRSDFRQHVNAHSGYLFDQAYNLPNRDVLLRHDVWGDCLAGGYKSIQLHPVECQKTITTPLVYQCFSSSYFANHLEERSPTSTMREKQNKRKHMLGFPTDLSTSSHQPISSDSNPMRSKVPKQLAIGDVVEVLRDTKTQWKETGKNWLAYVWRLQPLKNGTQKLGVVWLCRPSETVIGQMVYPIEKEVFFSDNCNCDEAPLLSTEVLRTHSIEFSPKDLNTNRDFLVRQKYVNGSFVTFKRSDLTCCCNKYDTRPCYQPGDTVYIETSSNIKSTSTLQPVLISETKPDNTVTVRYLRFLKRDCLGMLDPERRHALHENEVVWTDEFAQICADQIIRKCHVRWCSKDTVLSGNVPVPYNRRGNGDFFFLTRSRIRSRENGMRLKFLTKPPVSLTQGPDFEAKARVEPLRGLSIFGGSGNLDRGLEEGGAVEFHTVVDFNPVAIHTQKANARNPEKLDLYCWSVDDFLKALLCGKLVIDKVELIAGGAPCPGFSLLQKDPFGENSCRQASHITTICSFVDLLRPLYGIFENVASMASTRKGYEEDNILSQVVACFVAMGYQVRYDILDAWSYSSVQRRDRLFLYVAAPGLEPLDSPWHTHSHPETILGRSLGKGPNGLSLGDREDYATPFPFTTAQEAISDLPDIGQGCLQACISHPDHRTAPISLRDRIIMRNIPVYPPAQGYAEAMELGLIPQTVTRERSEVGKSYRRMQKHGLMPTVTTTMDAQNSRSSGVLHYEQHRPVTLEECKRAQGFLRYDVLIGNYSQALRTTGNAVDRNVAFIVGLLLREALERNYPEKQYTPPFPQNHDLVFEKRRAVSARLPRPRQEVPRPRLEVSNHNSITSATRFETLALDMCTIFRGGSTKETQPSALPSLESTPQRRTANFKKDNTIDNDLSLLSDEEVQTSVQPSSEATPQSTQAKRSRDYIRTISTTEESAPIKKTRHSEQRSKYRPTAIQHKETRHGTIHSVYSETRKVTIHIQHSVSESETINGEPSQSTKQIRETIGDQHSLMAHNSDTVDRHEVMDLTKGESEEAPLAKKALRPAVRKHKRNSEHDSYSTPAIESRNRTRGSGHQVEFTPTHWNKRPESMLRNKKD